MIRRIPSLLLILVLVAAVAAPVAAQDGSGRVRLGARLGDRDNGVRVVVNYAGNAEGAKLFKVRIRGRGLTAGTATVSGCGSGWSVDLTAREIGENTRVGGKLVLSARRDDAVPTCVAGNTVSVSLPGGLQVSGDLAPRRGRRPQG